VTSDNATNKFLRERMRELAGMFREKKKGTGKMLKKIMARFCIQEGVKRTTAKAYLKELEDSGLLYIDYGSGKWEYHPEEEWDLFTV